jgi:hypothetical protein
MVSKLGNDIGWWQTHKFSSIKERADAIAGRGKPTAKN